MFWSRLFSGIILVLIAIFTMGMGGIFLIGTLLTISLVAFRELTKTLRVSSHDTKFNGLEIVGLLGIVLYYVALYSTEADTMLLMCIVFVFIGMMMVYVVTFPKFTINQVLGIMFAYIYAPVMLSCIYLTRNTVHGFYMVWLILISSWGCDTCAYVVGKLIGRKKIFPILSPNKSLEGCIGGVLGVALIAGTYAFFVVEEVVSGQTIQWILIIICGLGAVMSMVGDLAASAIKRNQNIKDYGNLIPGHGGIMDRFDSMIFTAPMIYFLSILMIRF